MQARVLQASCLQLLKWQYIVINCLMVWLAGISSDCIATTSNHMMKYGMRIPAK
jgi:hypothetical protein